MFWNCVLYQNLLFKPCGWRNAAATGPSSKSPRAVTSKEVRPPKSVTACQARSSSGAEEESRPGAGPRASLEVISSPAASETEPRSA